MISPNGVYTKPPCSARSKWQREQVRSNPLNSEKGRLRSAQKTDEQTVIIEILSYMSLKSLKQFQLVCKEWRLLIHDHYFVEKHWEHWGRSKIVCHWYNVNPSSNSLRNKPAGISSCYIQGCDGLLLMRMLNKLCVWNPATRRVLEFPDPHKYRNGFSFVPFELPDDNYGFAFSFVPSTRSCRIVRIYKDLESGEKGCEFFTPGQSTAWRRLTFPDFLNSDRNREEKRVSVVSLEGSVHCVLVNKIGKEIVVEIVSLDLETEQFTINHFPEHLGPTPDWRKLWDIDWDGKLVFATVVGMNLELMELEDYKKQRWCGKKKVIHLPFLEKDINDGEANLIPLLARDGRIWFWLKYEKNDEKLFVYTIETGKLTDIKKDTFALANKIYPYKPSLIGFDGMVPDTKFEYLRANHVFE